MIVAVSFGCSVAGGWLLWAGLSGPLSGDRFSRENFRGIRIPAVGGVAVVIVAATASVVLLLAANGDDIGPEVSFAAFQLAVGFGVLGFLDDVAAEAGGGGFRGHLGALRSRKVTTGLVKLVGGVFVALLVGGLVTTGGGIGWLRDGALIAASANLANLFDRAPGRSLKVSIIVLAALVGSVGMAATLAPAAVVVGAALGVGWWELREKVMLGDTGVNVIGALVALSAVVSLGSAALWISLVVVVVLNLISEVVSFSRVIDRVTILRAVDRFGRPRV